MLSAAPLERLDVNAYTIPTDEPESDGTLEWDSTTIVVVEAHADGQTGLGYTYCDAAAAEVISSQLAGVVEGEDVMDVRAAWLRMTAQVRNAGQPGIGFCAVSAVDQALWDLKARLLDFPLVVLIGAAYDGVPIYGSGGFCSYSDERLCEQLGGWAEAGIPRVKMKVGREPERDPVRLDAAREAIGDDVELFVDANGAFARKEALAWAERYADSWNVTLVRGARLLGRHGRLAPDPGLGARRARDRGRRVRLRARRLPEPRRLRRLPPGRCHALRRHHGAPVRVRSRERALDRPVGPLRAGDLDARILRASNGAGTSSTSTTTSGSRRCSSTESPEPEDGMLRPDRSRPGNGLELKREPRGSPPSRWAFRSG